MNPSRIAVLVSGCGHRDGAEVNETVMTLLALRLQGFRPVAFALDEPLVDTVHHRAPYESETQSPPRNALTESGRILRGEILPMTELNPKEFAGLAMPGGFGVAKNFCTFAADGSSAKIHPTVNEVVSSFLAQKKPLLAVCISPALVGLVACKQKPALSLRMTLGDSANPASKIMTELGHTLLDCSSESCVVDPANKIVSTPAFMHEITLDQMWPGIQKAVKLFSDFIVIEPSSSAQIKTDAPGVSP